MTQFYVHGRRYKDRYPIRNSNNNDTCRSNSNSDDNDTCRSNNISDDNDT